ncbi:hypothetical protein [Aurantibacillus circumpalustris]|uniref:hypothetical protein n=1 Tax=Aurantibacillus circumpalustris TaxID=3036359 RepID=UPI00295BC29F|nr:hypothetical protein [Aurantibacillus circumpalustris]
MLNNSSKKIFVSLCGENQNSLRDELSSVLDSAGMNVLSTNAYSPETLVKVTEENILKANCSIHIIFPEYAPLLTTDNTNSISRFQFFEAKRKLASDPDFRIIVWLPPSTGITNVETKQLDFINEVRNNISKNMIFSNAETPIQLTDDIRSLLEFKDDVEFDTNLTDIFLISNQLDESEANEIMDMLSDIVPVERLSIVQDSDMDYSEYCTQQIGKSKLAVVYFKESGEWALPFTQQVWKKIGGASSHTPILLIGDEDPERNFNKKFKAPKVMSLIIAGELIPLEIKMSYDKVMEGKA